jgi:glycolate oxidase iron-sulfur subunit
MEGTRETLATQKRISPWWMKAGLRVLEHHRLLLGGSTALALVQRVLPKKVSTKLGLPDRLPFRRVPLTTSSSTADADAWFFPGCVMDAWQRPVHTASLRVMEATGARVALPTTANATCCGALHAHAGLHTDARRLASKLLDAFPGTAPIVINSAGCGAQLKDVGHLLDTPAGHAFAARVKDIHEWLLPRLAALPEPKQRFGQPVAIQDPCHLRHAQRAHEPVREVLERFCDVRILDDEGRCCGAGGAYSLLQPELATEIRSKKVGAISRTDCKIVASANPGCSLWLEQAGLDVRHPMLIIDSVLAMNGSYAHG